MKNQRKLLIFATCTFFLEAISPSIVVAKTILAEEKIIKAVIQTHEQGKKVKTIVNPLKIEATCYTDNADAAITFPKNSNSSIKIKDLEVKENSCFIALPSDFEYDGKRTNRDLILYNSKRGSKLGLQSTGEGFRALIQIDGAQASHEYTFTFHLQKGYRLITAKNYLGDEFDTGEIYVLNTQNQITSIISPAWARDAKGEVVSTFYTVEGDQLTQHIDFNEHSIFPIVADPDWGKVAKCVGALAWLVGSTMFGVVKITKIKRYIQALGGIREAAILMVTCSTHAERLQHGGQALLNLAAEISGISGVAEHCF
jgi:hypothetical protein